MTYVGTGWEFVLAMTIVNYLQSSVSFGLRISHGDLFNYVTTIRCLLAFGHGVGTEYNSRYCSDVLGPHRSNDGIKRFLHMYITLLCYTQTQNSKVCAMKFPSAVRGVEKTIQKEGGLEKSSGSLAMCRLQSYGRLLGKKGCGEFSVHVEVYLLYSSDYSAITQPVRRQNLVTCIV